MTQQLQDKKKLIEEVSNTIDNRCVFIQSLEHFVRCIFLLHILFIYLFSFIFFYLFLRLLQAEHNHSSVLAEIKNSICSLIAEMNKQGQMLLNQLEVWKRVSSFKSIVINQILVYSYYMLHLCTEACLFAGRHVCFALRPWVNTLEHSKYFRCRLYHVLSECNKRS